MRQAIGVVGDAMTPEPDADRLRAVIGGRVVLVTGASDGIGARTAVDCGRAGATVVLVARSEDKLAEVAEQIRSEGGTADVRPCDLADLDAVAALAKDVLADHGRVDVLVNNAGRSIRRGVRDTVDRFHDVERVFALNFFGAIRLMLELLPAMIEAGDGHVIQVSTQGTLAHVPRFSAYLASKAALEEYTRSIAGELLEDGVAFSNVHMPLVRTPMIAPTKAYQRLPAHNVKQASNILTRTMVTRAPSVSLGMHQTVGLVDRAAPRLWRRVQGQIYRLGA